MKRSRITQNIKNGLNKARIHVNSKGELQEDDKYLSNLQTGLKAGRFEINRRGNFIQHEVGHIHQQANRLDQPLLAAYQMIDPRTGLPLEHAVTVKNGRIHRADKKGIFREVDKAVLVERKRLRDELEEYIDELVEYCLIDPETTMDVLGMTETEYNDQLGDSDSPIKLDDGTVIPKTLAKYDARIETLETQVEGTSTMNGGIRKLRLIIKSRMPYIDDSGMTEHQMIKRSRVDEGEDAQLLDDTVAPVAGQ